MDTGLRVNVAWMKEWGRIELGVADQPKRAEEGGADTHHCYQPGTCCHPGSVRAWEWVTSLTRSVHPPDTGHRLLRALLR